MKEKKRRKTQTYQGNICCRKLFTPLEIGIDLLAFVVGRTLVPKCVVFWMCFISEYVAFCTLSFTCYNISVICIHHCFVVNYTVRHEYAIWQALCWNRIKEYIVHISSLCSLHSMWLKYFRFMRNQKATFFFVFKST